MLLRGITLQLSLFVSCAVSFGLPALPRTRRHYSAKSVTSYCSYKTRRSAGHAHQTCMKQSFSDTHMEDAAEFQTSYATNSAQALHELWLLISRVTTIDAPDQTFFVQMDELVSERGDAGDMAGRIVHHIQQCQQSYARFSRRTKTTCRLPRFEVSLASKDDAIVELRVTQGSFVETEGEFACSTNESAENDVRAQHVISATQEWVKHMIAPQSGMGLCPFTATATHGGLPKASIYYSAIITSPSSRWKIAEMYTALWKEASDLISLSEKERATSLLVTISDEFYSAALDSSGNTIRLFNLWTRSVDASNLEHLELNRHLHLVTFHPQYYQQPGAPTLTAHYARRSPYPIINWVRAKQIDSAQDALGSGYVFAAQNEATLATIGVVRLQQMLEEQHWSQLPKVDRSKGTFSLYFPRHFARFWLQGFRLPLFDLMNKVLRNIFKNKENTENEINI